MKSDPLPTRSGENSMQGTRFQNLAIGLRLEIFSDTMASPQRGVVGFAVGGSAPGQTFCSGHRDFILAKLAYPFDVEDDDELTAIATSRLGGVATFD